MGLGNGRTLAVDLTVCLAAGLSAVLVAGFVEASFFAGSFFAGSFFASFTVPDGPGNRRQSARMRNVIDTDARRAAAHPGE